MNKNESRKLTKEDLEFAHMAINVGKEHNALVEADLIENFVNSLEGKSSEVACQAIVTVATTLNAVELIGIVEIIKPLIAMRGIKDLKEMLLDNIKEEAEEEKKR